MKSPLQRPMIARVSSHGTTATRGSKVRVQARVRPPGRDDVKRSSSSAPCANVHADPLAHMLISQNLQSTVL
jgi:hypothetical protein